MSVDFLFSRAHAGAGTIQRRLAWPLRKDDTHKSRSVNNFLDSNRVPVHRAESRVHTLDARLLFLLCVYMHARMHSRVPSPFAKTTSGVQFFLRAGVLIMEDCGVGEGFQVTSWHCKEVAHTQSLRFGLFLPRAWDGMRARSTNIYHPSTSAAHGRGGPPNPGCWSCPGFCINTRDHITRGHKLSRP